MREVRHTLTVSHLDDAREYEHTNDVIGRLLRAAASARLVVKYKPGDIVEVNLDPLQAQWVGATVTSARSDGGAVVRLDVRLRGVRGSLDVRAHHIRLPLGRVSDAAGAADECGGATAGATRPSTSSHSGGAAQAAGGSGSIPAAAPAARPVSRIDAAWIVWHVASFLPKPVRWAMAKASRPVASDGEGIWRESQPLGAKMMKVRFTLGETDMFSVNSRSVRRPHFLKLELSCAPKSTTQPPAPASSEMGALHTADAAAKLAGVSTSSHKLPHELLKDCAVYLCPTKHLNLNKVGQGGDAYKSEKEEMLAGITASAQDSFWPSRWSRNRPGADGRDVEVGLQPPRRFTAEVGKETWEWTSEVDPAAAKMMPKQRRTSEVGDLIAAAHVHVGGLQTAAAAAHTTSPGSSSAPPGKYRTMKGLGPIHEQVVAEPLTFIVFRGKDCVGLCEATVEEIGATGMHGLLCELWSLKSAVTTTTLRNPERLRPLSTVTTTTGTEEDSPVVDLLVEEELQPPSAEEPSADDSPANLRSINKSIIPSRVLEPSVDGPADDEHDFAPLHLRIFDVASIWNAIPATASIDALPTTRMTPTKSLRRTLSGPRIRGRAKSVDLRGIEGVEHDDDPRETLWMTWYKAWQWGLTQDEKLLVLANKAPATVRGRLENAVVRSLAFCDDFLHNGHSSGVNVVVQAPSATARSVRAEGGRRSGKVAGAIAEGFATVATGGGDGVINIWRVYSGAADKAAAKLRTPQVTRVPNSKRSMLPWTCMVTADATSNKRLDQWLREWGKLERRKRGGREGGGGGGGGRGRGKGARRSTGRAASVAEKVKARGDAADASGGKRKAVEKYATAFSWMNDDDPWMKLLQDHHARPFFQDDIVQIRPLNTNEVDIARVVSASPLELEYLTGRKQGQSRNKVEEHASIDLVSALASTQISLAWDSDATQGPLREYSGRWTYLLTPPSVDYTAMRVFHVGDIVWMDGDELACVVQPLVDFSVPFTAVSPLKGFGGRTWSVDDESRATATAQVQQFCRRVEHRILDAVQRTAGSTDDAALNRLVKMCRAASKVRSAAAELRSRRAEGSDAQEKLADLEAFLSDACFPRRPVTVQEERVSRVIQCTKPEFNELVADAKANPVVATVAAVVAEDGGADGAGTASDQPPILRVKLRMVMKKLNFDSTAEEAAERDARRRIRRIIESNAAPTTPRAPGAAKTVPLIAVLAVLIGHGNLWGDSKERKLRAMDVFAWLLSAAGVEADVDADGVVAAPSRCLDASPDIDATVDADAETSEVSAISLMTLRNLFAKPFLATRRINADPNSNLNRELMMLNTAADDVDDADAAQWTESLKQFVVLRERADSRDSTTSVGMDPGSAAAARHGNISEITRRQFIDWYLFSVVNRHSMDDYCRAISTMMASTPGYLTTQRVVFADGRMRTVHLGSNTTLSATKDRDAVQLRSATHCLRWVAVDDGAAAAAAGSSGSSVAKSSKLKRISADPFTCAARLRLLSKLQKYLAETAVAGIICDNDDAIADVAADSAGGAVDRDTAIYERLQSFAALQSQLDRLIELCASNRTERALDAAIASSTHHLKGVCHILSKEDRQKILDLVHASMTALQRPPPGRRHVMRLQSRNASVTTLVAEDSMHVISGGNEGIIERWNIVDGTCTRCWRVSPDSKPISSLIRIDGLDTTTTHRSKHLLSCTDQRMRLWSNWETTGGAAATKTAHPLGTAARSYYSLPLDMDDIPVKEYDASFDLHDDHTGSKAKPQIVCAALVGMRNTDHKGDSVVFATGNSDGTIRLYELKIDRSTGGRPYTINALVGTDHKPLILECKDRGDEEKRFPYLPLNVSSRENDTVLSLACSSDLSLTDGNGDGNGGGDGDGNSDAGGDGAAGGAAAAAALGFHRGDFLVAGFASGHIVMWDISGFFDVSHSKTSLSTMRSKVRRQSSSAFVSHSIPKPILSLPAHFGGVEVVRIVSKCRTIITGSDDGTVCMWRLNRFVETGGTTSSSAASTDTDGAWVDVECIGSEKEFALHSKNRKKHVDHLGQFGVMQMVKEDGTSMDDTGTAATIQVCVHFRKDKINLDRELLRHFRQPPSLRLRFHSGAVRDLIVLQPREGEVKGVSDELPLLITASTDSDTRVWSKQHFKLLRTAPRVLGASARGEGSAAASEAHETPNPLLLLPSTDPANLEVYSE